MLSQFYAPVIGGEERHVQDLSTELVARGHEVTVVALAHPEAQAHEFDQGVEVVRIRSTLQRMSWLFEDSERQHAPPFPDPQALLSIRALLRRVQPDIIHAHNWLLHSFLPLQAWSKAALVVSLHDYSLVCAKKRLMYHKTLCSGPQLAKCLCCSAEHYGWTKGIVTALGSRTMEGLARAAVDMFLPVSQATAEGNRLQAYGLPYQIIPNFIVDHDKRLDSYYPGLEQLPQGDFLLFVGDLSTEKGIYTLLDAYSKLEDDPPLVLIGRTCGDTPKELPPHVVHLGAWPHAAVMEAWRRSSIALVPSVWSEPFGIVAIEAMGEGKPLIASNIGGLSDVVVDGETGLLVPPGDSAALAHAMQVLIGNRALRQRMGLAAAQRALEFRASMVVGRIEEVYYSILRDAVVPEVTQHLGEEKPGYRHV